MSPGQDAVGQDAVGRDTVERARALVSSSRFADAARVLGPYLADHPDEAEAHRVMGWAQYGREDLDAALHEVQTVARLAPDALTTQLLAATVHAARHEPAPARAAVEAAERIAPHAAVTHVTAAEVDIRIGLVTEQTLQSAKQAIRLDPQDADGYRLAGTTLLELKRRKEAGEYLQRAAAIDPADPLTANELARWNQLFRRSGAAATGFAALVRENPTNTVALRNLRITVWSSFSVAQLVLWVTMVVLSRVMLLTNGDPGSWVRFVGPLAVALTLLAWAFLLRRAHSGLTPMRQVVRTDRGLQIGLAAHLLCLVTLLWSTTLDPRGTAGTVGLLLAIGLLLVATATVFRWNRRQRKELAQRSR